MSNIITKIWNMIENVLFVILRFFFGLVHKELSDVAFGNFMQFVRFGIVGISNTLISYVLYAGSLLLFQKFGVLPNGDYLVAHIIEFVLSVAWSFYWNNKMVFVKEEGQKRSIWKALIKTYISYSFTGLFLNSILLVLWIQVFSISEFVAPIINLIVSVPINFLINKFWAFK